MIRRFCLLWDLQAHESYIKLLKREGWTDEETAALRKHCQAIRVQLALHPARQVEDAITDLGCLLAGLAIAAGLVWEWWK